jgi:hypothetical protein
MDWELPEGMLEDDPEEVVRPYVVVEVANVSLPSSMLLGRSLAGTSAGALSWIFSVCTNNTCH